MGAQNYLKNYSEGALALSRAIAIAWPLASLNVKIRAVLMYTLKIIDHMALHEAVIGPANIIDNVNCLQSMGLCIM